MKIKYSVLILLIIFIFNIEDASAQMTQWQMDNFKKNDKSRQNKIKGKGANKRVKKTKSNRVKSFGGGKTFFTRKKYKVAQIGIIHSEYEIINLNNELYFIS